MDNLIQVQKEMDNLLQVLKDIILKSLLTFFMLYNFIEYDKNGALRYSNYSVLSFGNGGWTNNFKHTVLSPDTAFLDTELL